MGEPCFDSIDDPGGRRDCAFGPKFETDDNTNAGNKDAKRHVFRSPHAGATPVPVDGGRRKEGYREIPSRETGFESK